MKTLTKIIILTLTIATISSCINLKEPYPNINYFALKAEKSVIENVPKINGCCVIRDFSIAGEFNTERMIARESDGKTVVYFYNRWVTDFGELATTFFKTKLNEMSIFSGGTDRLSSTAQPDYIIEGSVLSLEAYNGINSKDTSYVNLIIKINFFHRNQNLFENKQILSETYTQKMPRTNADAASIAPAFSKAISIISDKVIIDISNAALKEGIEK